MGLDVQDLSEPRADPPSPDILRAYWALRREHRDDESTDVEMLSDHIADLQMQVGCFCFAPASLAGLLEIRERIS